MLVGGSLQQPLTTIRYTSDLSDGDCSFLSLLARSRNSHVQMASLIISCAQASCP